ncbi:MAG TPA: arsenate reductase (glutaredoxin) [Stellaceae bacterium]|nr:arsenate reductase (glutaredoxin) [Stellaceae bacterium]
MSVTIYFNQRCGTARTVLAAIREKGIEPTIINYLETPPSRETLKDLARKAGFDSAAGLLRRKETQFTELNLENATEDQALDAMAAHPILMERPIVVTDKGVRVCRPADKLAEVL